MAGVRQLRRERPSAKKRHTLCVGAFGGWLWRRHRHHYAGALVVVSGIMLLGGIVIPAAIAASLYLNFSVRDTIWWTASVAVVDSAGMAIAIVIDRATLAPVIAWANRDFSDPAASWNSALSMPPILATTAAQACTVLSFTICVPFGLYLGQRTVTAAMALVLGMSAVVAFAGLMFGGGLHAMLRPCSDEIEQTLAIEEAPSYKDWTLQNRLTLSFGVTTVIAGIGVTGFTLGTGATPRHFLLAVLFSIILGLYLILVNRIGLITPASTSINDLVAGVKRVRGGDFSTRVPVTTVDELGELAFAFNEMQVGLREREDLRAAFGSYVDPTLAARLLSQGDLKFAGEEVDVTVFFADVRSFTSYVESTSAPEAVARLNQLFEILVPVIQDQGGHANHYLGDGLLAVFGTPSPLANHADRAVAAALEIQRRVHAEFAGEVRIGIGINSGFVTAGTIGGGGRLEFTVIGDTVNVASRLERMTKETGDAILVTQATMDALRTTSCPSISRGDVELRGKAACVSIHALLAES
jgi:class 3 adenylate cyclase